MKEGDSPHHHHHEMKSITTWQKFTEESVESTRRGVRCINQQILDSIVANPVGFYIYTDETNYAKKKYKCGQSKRGLQRLGEQAQQSETMMIVDWIPSEDALIGGRDQQIHQQLHEGGTAQWLYRMDKDASPGKEWSVFPDNNPGELWWEALNGKTTRTDLSLTLWQQEAINRIISSLDDGNKVIMAELAARFGKTTTYLSLFDILQKKVLVIGSYVLTVSSSFKKEARKFSQFENMEVLELTSPTFKSDFNKLMKTDKQIVVFASLCGGSVADANAPLLTKVADKLVVIDEADYGAHTESKVPVVKQLTGNSPLVLTTGTNSERARGQHDIDDVFSVTYFDMLMKRDHSDTEFSNRYARATKFEQILSDAYFYAFDWSNYVPSEEFEGEVEPSFSKASTDVNKCRGFWTGLYSSLVGNSSTMEANDFNLFDVINKSGEELQSVIQFVSMTKKQMAILHKLATQKLGESFEVVSINGDITNNKNSEEYIKDKLRKAKEAGKHVWIIASQMCQRSFSIPEINTVILSYDKGDRGASIQKMSRALTAGSNKTIGHIVSLSIDGNRDEKISTIVMETAKKEAESTESDMVQAVKKVLRTLPIFQMVDGDIDAIDVDTYAKELFSSSNSHRLIVDRERLLAFNLNDASVSILLGSKIPEAEKEKIEAAFKNGKTYKPQAKIAGQASLTQKSLIEEIKNNLIRLADRLQQTIKLVQSYERDLTLDQFTSMLTKHQSLADTLTVSSSDFKTLLAEGYINTNLLSLLVKS